MKKKEQTQQMNNSSFDKPILELRNIEKKYDDKVVLKRVNLKIKPQEYVAIVGQSGSGKSTLMNIIGAFDRDFTGEFLFMDQKLDHSSSSIYRNNHIGFIFQQFNLIPGLTVLENIMLPYAFSKRVIPSINEKCKQYLDEFGLAGKDNQNVSTLSGGEKQRVALIRSIIMDPEIILADEPTGNLDPYNSKLISDFLFRMNKEDKVIIVVTHDLEFANNAKRKMCIKNGEIIDITQDFAVGKNIFESIYC